jgi:uncharacterized integral membrane protein
MATLIVIVLFGLIIGFLATQNTATIPLRFLNYTFSGIPIFVVVVGSLLAGLFISWIVSLVNSVTTGLTIHGKESKIKDINKENAELNRKVHQLELENERLKGAKNSVDEKSL